MENNPTMITNKDFYGALKTHRDETLEVLKNFSGELKEEVTNQIKITVNGKIDKIAKHLEDQDKSMSDLILALKRAESVTEPIIERQKAFKVFGTYFKDARSFVISISSLIGALGVIYIALVEK